jgi:hypothetical protein
MVKNNRLLSDCVWLCQLDEMKGINIFVEGSPFS